MQRKVSSLPKIALLQQTTDSVALHKEHTHEVMAFLSRVSHTNIAFIIYHEYEDEDDDNDDDDDALCGEAV